MKPLAPLIRLWRIAYYRWARHELQRQGRHCDPDMPHIIATLAELER